MNNRIKEMVKENKYKMNCKKRMNFYKEAMPYKEESVFFSLAPKDDVDDKNIYYNKFMTAVDKGCKIIAFTGRYGIGKTSIINSIIKKLDNNNREIRISLGSYKESNIENIDGKACSINENDSFIEFDTNYIEAKILQQIIYTTDENKLPMSRFKRIRYISKTKKKLMFIISILVMFLVYIYFPQVCDLIFLPMYNKCIKVLPKEVVYAICFLLLLTITYIIYKVISCLNMTINVSSLKYKDLEIAFNNKEERSVFNKYLDEIVYFFKQTETNTLIIEDLDRYGNISLEIFKNLKELNFLLNSNETIRKKGGVIFIYALRDDLFLNNEDRVKFFDSIIPVVSKFSSQNAKEYIKELYKEIQKSYSDLILDEKLLRLVSIHIQDRRLLLNIFMEFKTYIDALKDNQDINYTELFAVISYKNINPTDFEKRLKYDGDLYNLFNYKQRVINILNEDLVRENARINKEIDYAIKNNNLDIIDLKKSFILDTIKNNYNSGYVKNIKIYINDRDLSLDDFLSYEIDTTKIRNAELQYAYPGYSREKINTEVLNQFLDRIDKLKYDVSPKKKEIELNIKNIEKNNHKSIEEILNTDGLNDLILDNDLKSIFENKLLISLTKNGFIKENYEKNLSYFKSGDLSPNDYKFLIYVDTNEKLDFNHRINNIEEVFKLIEVKDFSKETVLNFDLCDYLIKSEDILKIDNFCYQFENNNDYKFSFLDEYLKHNEKNCMALLKMITNENLYNYILQNENPIINKSKWIKIILENIDLGSKKELLESFKKYLDNNIEFFNDIEINSVFELNIKNIAPNINDYQNVKLEIIDLFYKIDIYYPNKSFYDKLIDLFEVDSIYKTTDFLNLIYENSNFLKFKNKIFCSKSFSKIYNCFEIYDSSEINIINAINEQGNSKENRLLILEKENNKIFNIKVVEDYDIWKDIIKGNHCNMSMDNLIAYYEKVKEIDDIIIEMLVEIGNDYDITNDDVFKEFEEKLIYSKYNIKIKYGKIAEKFSYQITQFNDELELNNEFIGELINYNKISINIKTYNKIYESKNTGSLITLITKNIEGFIDILDSINIDYNIIDGIMMTKIDISKKLQLFSRIEAIKLSNESITNLIEEIIDKKIQLNDEIANKLFEHASEKNKIKYFIYLHSQNRMNIKYLYKINDKISKIRNGSSTTISFEYNDDIEKLMKYLEKENIVRNLEIKNNKMRVSYSKLKL